MARLHGKYSKFHEMPSFNKGQLVFEQSGHSLTFVNGYYRCSLKQKGKCNINHEKNFKYEVFERRLSRAIKTLKLEEAIARKIFYDWDKQAVDLREKVEEEADLVIQAMEATILVMKEKLKKTKKISAQDNKEARERYGKLIKISFPCFIHSSLNAGLKALTVIGKTRIGDGLFISVGFEKIYIDNEGKILKVKLEGINDFLFQYIERIKPDYCKKLNFELIDRIKFPSLKFLDVMEFFKNNDYKNTLSYSPFVSKYAFEKQLKKQSDLIKTLPPIEQIKMWETLKDKTWQNPHIFFSGLAVPYREN